MLTWRKGLSLNYLFLEHSCGQTNTSLNRNPKGVLHFMLLHYVLLCVECLSLIRSPLLYLLFSCFGCYVCCLTVNSDNFIVNKPMVLGHESSGIVDDIALNLNLLKYGSGWLWSLESVAKEAISAKVKDDCQCLTPDRIYWPAASTLTHGFLANKVDSEN